MSFHPFMEKYVRLAPVDSVCELGNQTWRGISAEHYYRSIGCKRYVCLDCNKNYGAVLANLNEPFDLPGDRFSMVTNNGTGEHIFDQAQILKTMHDLCAVGGRMIHVMPFHNWHNHGFYSYHPVLYRDLAKANGYTVQDLRLANRWGDSALLAAEDMERAKPEKGKSGRWARGKSLIAKLDSLLSTGEPTVFVACILRKDMDQAFRKPMQDIYDGANDDYHKERG